MSLNKVSGGFGNSQATFARKVPTFAVTNGKFKLLKERLATTRRRMVSECSAVGTKIMGARK